jgi:hypothetical protein
VWVQSPPLRTIDSKVVKWIEAKSWPFVFCHCNRFCNHRDSLHHELHPRLDRSPRGRGGPSLMPGSLSRRRSGRRSTLAPPIAVTGRAIETRWHGCTFPAHADRELRLRFLRRYRRAKLRLAAGPPGAFRLAPNPSLSRRADQKRSEPALRCGGNYLGENLLGTG